MLEANPTVVALLAQTSTASVNFALTQRAVTPVPTSSPTAVPTLAPSIEPPTLTPISPPIATDSRIPVTLNPAIVTDLEAPIRIEIPDGWKSASDALLIPGAEGMSAVPFSLYQGSVTGGTGTIVLLWAFESVVPVSPTGSLLSGVNLFSDGLRLLLFTIIEAECEFVYDEARTFTVGGLQGEGTYFVADDCPDDLPSIRGWFWAANIEGLNFAFYAYTEPKEALEGSALEELQAILDTVEFDLSLLPTPAPTELPFSVITLTPEPTSGQPILTEAPPTSDAILPTASPTARVVFVTATPAP